MFDRCLIVTALASWMAVSQQPPSVPPQAPRPVVRSSTELVEVDVVVTDKRGGPVRDLRREDFQITEDGRAQEVVAFDLSDRASAPAASAGAAPAAASPEVSTNVIARERRVYVIALDTYNVSPARSDSVRREARRFVTDHLEPGDVAAVVILGDAKRSQSFTSDKTRLTAAVDRFIGQKSGSAALNQLSDAFNKQPGRQSAEIAAEDPETALKAANARSMLDSVSQICRSLGGTALARRSLLLFSEGIELDLTDLIGEDKRAGAGGKGLSHESSRYAGVVLDAWRDMINAAQRANVALSTVEPRGNTTGNEGIMQAQIERDAGGKPLPPVAVPMMREAQRGQGTLRTFASETGGAAIVGTDNFAAGFKRVVEANSVYYLLGYRSSNPARDGKYRKITVSVKGRDVEVVARKGYYAADAKGAAREGSAAPASDANAPSPRMRQLLANPLPVQNGLDVRVTASPIRRDGDATVALLVIELDTSGLQFVEDGGTLANDVELAFVAVDADGVVRGGNRSLGALRVPLADRGTVTHGLRYVTEFPLPAGRYEIRAAAFESAGGTAGSAALELDTRTVGNGVPALAGLLVTTPRALSVPTTGAYPTIKARFPWPPTTSREFGRDETLTVMCNLVGSGDATDGSSLVATVRDRAGHESFSTPVPLDASTALRDVSGYTPIARVPLGSLAPGTYELSVEFRPLSGQPSNRSLAFVVR